MRASLRRLGRAVYVAGSGLVPVTRQQPTTTLDGMGAAAVRAALADAGAPKPTALFVGNMMSGMLSWQQHLGPLVATAAALGPVETFTAEVCQS